MLLESTAINVNLTYTFEFFNVIKRNLDSIQFLRAVAVLLVVFFHYRFDLSYFITNSATLFFNGSIGVDLFFVISGFIIYFVTDNNKSGFNASISFIFKRVIRVIPPYFIMTMVFVYFGGYSIDNLMNSLLFLPSTTSEAPFYGYPSLVVGWSLNYEIYFYLAAFIGILAFKNKKWLFVTLGIMTIIITPAIVKGNLLLSSTFNYGIKSAYLSMITNSIIIDFVFGVLCGWITKNVTFSSKIVVSLSIISIFFFTAVYFIGFRSEHGPILWGFASFMLVLSFVELEKKQLIYIPKTMTAIGDISFSIYLIHIPVLVWSHYIFNNTYPLYSLEHKGIYISALSIILTCLGSIVYYIVIEKGLCNALRSYLTVVASYLYKKMALQ